MSIINNVKAVLFSVHSQRIHQQICTYTDNSKLLFLLHSVNNENVKGH